MFNEAVANNMTYLVVVNRYRVVHVVAHETDFGRQCRLLLRRRFIELFLLLLQVGLLL